ncbi:hypothetical protein [Erwinia sp. V71]
MDDRKQFILTIVLIFTGSLLLLEVLGKVRFNRWGSVESLAVLALP